MELELLQKNILAEKTLINSLLALSDFYKKADSKKKAGIEKQMDLTLSQIKMVNSAIPELVNSIHLFNPINSSLDSSASLSSSKSLRKESKLVNIKSNKEDLLDVTIKKEHEDKFVKNIKKSVDLLEKEDKFKETVAGSSSYIRFSNKLFKNTSLNLSKKDFFINIKSDLRKMGSLMLISSYISVMFMTTLIMFVLGLFIAIPLFFFNINYFIPLLVILIFPAVTFIAFYSYPSSNVKSLEKSINQELPFMTIFMSAIATSGIEPSKIFSILLSSQDYPATSREIKKLINYINFYGYDLVSALRVVSKTCPSERLGLLFDGMATSITSGGELSSFLNKHSETLLFDYRLEREKYTHLAETFMNIYISVVIAAPMILMVLLILMSLTGFGGAGLSPGFLTFVIVFGIGLLNVGFLAFLNFKQPKF
jgi:Flp pilus assembly protein TadB